MRRLLLDTNIVLDLFLQRGEHKADATRIWNAIESGQVEGFLAAHSVTTVHYFLRKATDGQQATVLIKRICELFQIAAVDAQTIKRAVSLQWSDFEDAVTAASAIQAGCEAIVTRDPAGFRKASIRVMSAHQAASALGL